MSDDTSAALIASLDVKFDQLANNMKKAISVFNNGGLALEKRQAQIKKNLSSWAIDFSGLGGLNKALVGLTGVAVIGGIGDLVKKSLDAASAIGDTAQQAGVGAEFLQKLRFAASQSGASFDVMDSALTTLNKSLGDFVTTGAGKGAAAFKALGIDKLINSGQVRDAEDAFDAIAKGIQKFGSEAQKSSLLAGVFGKEAGPQLLQLMNQGADGIAKLEAQAVSLGIVLSTQTIAGAKDASDKLEALFSVMKAQGVSAVASLAPEIASLAQNITNGLPDLITWVEKWAQWFGLIKLSPLDDLKVKLADAQKDLANLQDQKANNTGFWKSLFGESDADFDTFIAAAKAKVKDLQSDIAIAPVTVTPSQIRAPKPAALHVATTAEDKAVAEKRAALLTQTGVDAATAGAALTAAQDQTSLQLLKGSANYYAAVQKQINDEYDAKVTVATAESAKQKAELDKQGKDWAGYAAGVANINTSLTDKVAAAAEDRKQKLDAAGPTSLIRDALTAGDQQIRSYQEQTDALGLTIGALAKQEYYQGLINDAREKGITLTRQEIELNPDLKAKGDAIAAAAVAADKANQTYQNQVELTGTLRDGLEGVAEAGLHGFSSMKDAAADFLDTLAQTILKLYVMQPILDSLFGKQGSAGGGILGDAIGGASSFFAGLFATGGTIPSGQWGIVGDKGPEPVRATAGGIQVMPNSSLKSLSAPTVPTPAANVSQSGNSKVDFNIHVTGTTDAEIMQQVRTAVGQGIATYDRSALPGRVNKLVNDQRRRY